MNPTLPPGWVQVSPEVRVRASAVGSIVARPKLGVTVDGAFCHATNFSSVDELQEALS